MIRRWVTALAGAAVATAAGHADSTTIAWAGAALSGTTMALLTWRAVADAAGDDPFACARELNKGLAAWFSWAGLSMAGGYYLTPQSWYHAYQYALAFLLLALIVIFVGQKILGPATRTKDPVRARTRATLLQALSGGLVVAGLVAVMFLFVSGKLSVHRADWLANVVFVSAALGAIIAAASSLKLLHGAKAQLLE